MQNPILAEQLGAYIRRKRKEKSITQKSLKDKLGFSAQFLGHIESGKAMVPEAALKILIVELDLEYDDLNHIFSESSGAYLRDLFNSLLNNFPESRVVVDKDKLSLG